MLKTPKTRKIKLFRGFRIWERVGSTLPGWPPGYLATRLLDILHFTAWNSDGLCCSFRSGRGAMADLNAASRFEKSLGLLTTRFVNLLQEARDGVLDLKVVSISSKQC